MLQGRLPPRGDPLRIALIHSVYGAGWALVSIAAGGGVSAWPAAAALLFAIVLAAVAAKRLRGHPPAEPLNPKAARWMRKVNIVTAFAALLYGWTLSQAGREAAAIAAVLVVVGLHLVPMWLLLRRSSLLAIGVALTAIGALVWNAPMAAATGCFFAALIFAGNAARLVLR